MLRYICFFLSHVICYTSGNLQRTWIFITVNHYNSNAQSCMMFFENLDYINLVSLWLDWFLTGTTSIPCWHWMICSNDLNWNKFLALLKLVNKWNYRSQSLIEAPHFMTTHSFDYECTYACWNLVNKVAISFLVIYCIGVLIYLDIKLVTERSGAVLSQFSYMSLLFFPSVGSALF